jgi:hypothetical protein
MLRRWVCGSGRFESLAFIFKVSVVHEEFLVGNCNDGKPVIQRDSNKSQTAGVFLQLVACLYQVDVITSA